MKFKMLKILIIFFLGFSTNAQKTDSSKNTFALTLGFGSQTNISCFGQSNGTAAVLVATGGMAPFTYNWTPGNPTGDGTISVSGLSAGTWTCTVTDALGATAARFFSITQPSALILTSASQTNVSVPGASDGTASVNNASGGTAPYSYNWSPGNPTGDGTVSITNLSVGSYTCQVIDSKNCFTNKTFIIGIKLSLSAASQVNVCCFGGSNGAAAINEPIGGTGPFTYNWTPGNPTGDGSKSVSGLTAGTWTCTTMDSQGATANKTFTITQPNAITASQLLQTNVSTTGANDGAASINEPTGGTSPYTYNWTPGNPIGDGTKSVTGLTQGTWTCNIFDINGCLGQRVFSILVRLNLSANSQTNVSCFGGSNGTASVNTASGGQAPYTYNWTPGNPTGDGSESVSNLTAGTYTCTVTDALGSIKQQIFTISQPALLVITDISKTDVTCPGGSNGTAAINSISGGTAPYSINWTPGNPSGDGTFSVTGLTAGPWTSTVTDQKSCQAQQVFNIETEFSGQNISLARPQNNISSGEVAYKTTKSIIANISIEGNSKVLLHAGNSILLDGLQGVFEVKIGVVFEAKVEGCNP